MSSVRVRFCEGETGWAEDVGESKYRINNIPLADDLNIDDIVYCDKGSDGFLEILDVVERKYLYKTLVRYKNVADFAAICDKMKAAGFKVEGMIGPNNGRRGLCLVAHDASVDFDCLKELDIEVETTLVE